MSDVHHDNAKCRHDIERRHLEQAKQCNALVLDFGDYFCAMQGKYDKRSSRRDLRPEYQCGNYLDLLVSNAADFLAPYAPNIGMMAIGNHEASIAERHETDLTERLVERLKAGCPKTQVRRGGFRGWVIFKFINGTTKRFAVRLWYTHGYGGGGPVTKDMIQRNRQMVEIMDADIFVSGHTHDRWCDETVRESVTKDGQIRTSSAWAIKCSTYKDEVGYGDATWHNLRGGKRKPIGGWWLEFFFSSSRGVWIRPVPVD